MASKNFVDDQKKSQGSFPNHNLVQDLAHSDNTLANRLSQLLQPKLHIRQNMNERQTAQNIEMVDNSNDVSARLKKKEEELMQLRQMNKSLTEEKFFLEKTLQQEKLSQQKMEEERILKQKIDEKKLLELEKEEQRLVKEKEEQEKLIEQLREAQRSLHSQTKKEGRRNESEAQVKRKIPDQGEQYEQPDSKLDAEEEKEVAQALALAMECRFDRTAEQDWAEWDDESDAEPKSDKKRSKVDALCSEVVHSVDFALDLLSNKNAKGNADDDLIRDYTKLLASKDDIDCLFGVRNPGQTMDCKIHRENRHLEAGCISPAYSGADLSKEQQSKLPAPSFLPSHELQSQPRLSSRHCSKLQTLEPFPHGYRQESSQRNSSPLRTSDELIQSAPLDQSNSKTPIDQQIISTPPDQLIPSSPQLDLHLQLSPTVSPLTKRRRTVQLSDLLYGYSSSICECTEHDNESSVGRSKSSGRCQSAKNVCHKHCQRQSQNTPDSISSIQLGAQKAGRSSSRPETSGAVDCAPTSNDYLHQVGLNRHDRQLTKISHHQELLLSPNRNQHLSPSRHHQQHRSPSRHHHQHRSPSRHHQQHRSPSRHHHQHRSPSRHHHQHRSPSRHHHQHRSPNRHHHQHRSPSRHCKHSSPSLRRRHRSPSCHRHDLSSRQCHCPATEASSFNQQKSTTSCSSYQSYHCRDPQSNAIARSSNKDSRASSIKSSSIANDSSTLANRKNLGRNHETVDRYQDSLSSIDRRVGADWVTRCITGGLVQANGCDSFVSYSDPFKFKEREDSGSSGSFSGSDKSSVTSAGILHREFSVGLLPEEDNYYAGHCVNPVDDISLLDFDADFGNASKSGPSYASDNNVQWVVRQVPNDPEAAAKVVAEVTAAAEQDGDPTDIDAPLVLRTFRVRTPPCLRTKRRKQRH